MSGKFTEGFYKTFFDIAPIALYITSVHDGTFIRANPACVKLLGFSSLEEMKNNIKTTELYPKVIRNELLKKIKEEGYVENFEIQLSLPNATQRWIMLSAAPCENNNYLIGSAIDVTQLRLLEQSLENYQRMEIKEIKNLKNCIADRIRDYPDKECDNSLKSSKYSGKKQSFSADKSCI